MTRKEAIRLTQQESTLRALGFSRDEAAALRRISMTLHRWHEHECNGNIKLCADNRTSIFAARKSYPESDEVYMRIQSYVSEG